MEKYGFFRMFTDDVGIFLIRRAFEKEKLFCNRKTLSIKGVSYPSERITVVDVLVKEYGGETTFIQNVYVDEFTRYVSLDRSFFSK